MRVTFLFRFYRHGIVLTSAALFAAAFMTGCVSYSGDSLVMGKSTAGEVEAVMGHAAEKMDGEGGDKIWFYPRGRQTFAVRIGSNGTLRDIEPRFTAANRAKLVFGKTTTRDVRSLLGPPALTARHPRIERDFWEYRMTDGDFQTTAFKTLSLEFSYDGVLRGWYFYDDPNDVSSGCLIC
jgi:hypothetical protein